MKKITKKVREEAAMICAIAASAKFFAAMSHRDVVIGLDGVEGRLREHGQDPAFTLSLDAWMCAFDRHAELPDAEAEALIRTGWCPGDEP